MAREAWPEARGAGAARGRGSRAGARRAGATARGQGAPKPGVMPWGAGPDARLQNASRSPRRSSELPGDAKTTRLRRRQGGGGGRRKRTPA